MLSLWGDGEGGGNICGSDIICIEVCFFFSSRRRHTRSSTVSWGSEMCIRDRSSAIEYLTYCKDDVLS